MAPLSPATHSRQATVGWQVCSYTGCGDPRHISCRQDIIGNVKATGKQRQELLASWYTNCLLAGVTYHTTMLSELQLNTLLVLTEAAHCVLLIELLDSL